MRADPDGTAWSADPLPRGRHKLSAEEVRTSQRERILRAMLELVGERGYAATSVPDVVTLARVSRTGFYRLFSDKAECFVALVDELATELLDRLFELRQSDDWHAAVRRGMTSYLEFWRAHPLFARAYLVELPAAGERLMDYREREFARFQQLLEALAGWAREEDPSLRPLNPLATYLLVGGITEIVAREVRAGRVSTLPRLGDELVELVEKTLR